MMRRFVSLLLLAIAVVPAGAAVPTPAQVKALLQGGATAFYTFSQTWTVAYNGQTLHFRNGVAYELDSALQTFLTALRRTARC